MKIMKNDEAVSPVIGTILMVAITVILAAVIAAFVFGMVGSTGTSKTVGLSVQKINSTHITVTITGGADIPSMNRLNLSIDGTDYGGIKDITSSTTEITSFTVGKIITNKSPATDYDGKRVILIGGFKDGSTQILWDRTL